MTDCSLQVYLYARYFMCGMVDPPRDPTSNIQHTDTGDNITDRTPATGAMHARMLNVEAGKIDSLDLLKLLVVSPSSDYFITRLKKYFCSQHETVLLCQARFSISIAPQLYKQAESSSIVQYFRILRLGRQAVRGLFSVVNLVRSDKQSATREPLPLVEESITISY
jgi:hypothetical protein